jgi:hypothetical protein
MTHEEEPFLCQFVRQPRLGLQKCLVAGSMGLECALRIEISFATRISDVDDKRNSDLIAFHLVDVLILWAVTCISDLYDKHEE